MGNGGLLVLRLALVILSAFVAAAFTQRLLLANFAVKVGSLDIPAIEDAAGTLVEETSALRSQVADHATKIATSLDRQADLLLMVTELTADIEQLRSEFREGESRPTQ